MSNITHLNTGVSESRHREFKHRVNNREPNKKKKNPSLYVTLIGNPPIENPVKTIKTEKTRSLS